MYMKERIFLKIKNQWQLTRFTILNKTLSEKDLDQISKKIIDVVKEKQAYN